MTSGKPAEDLAALERLLDREREALVTGDLGGLAALLDAKSALIGRLGPRQPGERPALDRLKEKALRNQALLDGARLGLRQAVRRIGASRETGRAFDTYDRAGHRHRIGPDTPGRVEKRS